MNKKEFYEAPEWAMRALMLERTPICASPGEPSDDEGYNDPNDGKDY